MSPASVRRVTSAILSRSPTTHHAVTPGEPPGGTCGDRKQDQRRHHHASVRDESRGRAAKRFFAMPERVAQFGRRWVAIPSVLLETAKNDLLDALRNPGLDTAWSERWVAHDGAQDFGHRLALERAPPAQHFVEKTTPKENWSEW